VKSKALKSTLLKNAERFDGNSFYEWHQTIGSEFNFYQNKTTLAWSSTKETEDSCEYILNSNKFRCEELEKNNVNSIFVGCSETFGLGGAIEDCWSYMVYQKLKDEKPFVNLGVPGSGWSESIYNIFVYISNYGVPKNIFMLLPNIERRTVYGYPYLISFYDDQNNNKLKITVNDVNIKNFNTVWFPPINNEYVKYPKKYALDEDDYQTLIRERYDQISILSKFCKLLNINLIFTTLSQSETDNFKLKILPKNLDQFPGFVLFDTDEYVKDYATKAFQEKSPKLNRKYDGHSPILWHEYCADKMYSKWMELNDNSRS
jgi:hypothetical protein